MSDYFSVIEDGDLNSFRSMILNNEQFIYEKICSE
jgi:hypothetical protein